MNRLKDSTSPYLLQHANNPVEWWPWCDEALQLARQESKPILLSIGYSACHWCHVMAHESFEDSGTAVVMNELFVNIKVDREERPDLDKIYQAAHQLLSQRPGGWPLTVFLAPDDHVPFFAGTYFPDSPRHGMISFVDLLQRVDGAWREQEDAIREQNNSVLAALQQLNQPGKGGADLDAAPLMRLVGALQQNFDDSYGGFGRAPKFPHPTNLEQLLRFAASNPGDEDALSMAKFTLERMARGGINDQLRGGFFRYSVDEKWMIPHFEKMLYDNAPLIGVYADAWKLTGSELFKTTVEKTAQWVMDEMQAAEGGYYSTLDADSGGEEGAFYCWSREEIRGLMDTSEYELFASYYGLHQNPNFERKWHLHASRSLSETADRAGMSESEAAFRLTSAKNKLLGVQEQRNRPGRDEKILTSWNAQMISGLARASRLFGNPEWLVSAQKALEFIRMTMWRDGRLLATSKDGTAHLPAYLDDYAFLMDALLELLQLRWKHEDLELTVDLAEVLLVHFQDHKHGGFFFTADDHEALIHRPKSYGDDSLPSGNGVAAYALQRLGYLLGEPRYLEAAERTLQSARGVMLEMPHGHCALLRALDEYLHPTEIVVLRGDEARLTAWMKELNSVFKPSRILVALPDNAELPVALAAKETQEGGVIYVCEGTLCKPPVTSVELIDGSI